MKDFIFDLHRFNFTIKYTTIYEPDKVWEQSTGATISGSTFGSALRSSLKTVEIPEGVTTIG